MRKNATPTVKDPYVPGGAVIINGPAPMAKDLIGGMPPNPHAPGGTVVINGVTHVLGHAEFHEGKPPHGVEPAKHPPARVTVVRVLRLTVTDEDFRTILAALQFATNGKPAPEISRCAKLLEELTAADTTKEIQV